MADQEHLNKLKEGVEAWNKWRYEYEDIEPELSDINFRSADLSCINFSYTNLKNADIRNADLKDADFRSANLKGAKLSGADLSHANLFSAKLSGANLFDANLSSANLKFTILMYTNLSRAYINGVDFRGANFFSTDLTEARVGSSIFGNVDLGVAKGLETVRHDGPSTIGIDTIYRSHGNIPEVFLKGAGVDDTFITYIRSLVGQAIEFYSCFISYSSKDEAFAKRLYADLQSHNVRCWFAPHDMKIGDRIRDRIDDSVRIYEKLLIILSEHSIASDWVEDEVDAALEKERVSTEQGKKQTILFPIRLDDAVKTTTQAWAAKFRRQRHIGDFCDWKNHDEYEKMFVRLLDDLKVDLYQTEIKGK